MHGKDAFYSRSLSSNIENMFSLNDLERQTLLQLGRRLRTARMAFRRPARETQTEFAARIAYWIRALNLLDRLEEIDGLLQPKRSLFDDIDQRRS